MSKHFKKKSGFVLLYAVVIASVILSIAVSITNIAYKEIHFSVSGENTNEAFFAADIGAECALFNDRTGSTSFSSSGTTVNCLGGNINLSGTYPIRTFVLSSLGSSGQACARVTVDKSVSSTTTITSKGYDKGNSSCASLPAGVLERELKIIYGGSVPTQVAYRYVRWEITKRKADTNSIQVSEIRLRQDGVDVAWPSGTLATNPGGSTPPAENPPKVIDGNTATKWLDFNFAPSGGQTGFSRLDIDTGPGNSVKFNSYRWATANDASDRDPISWSLYGSNNGTTYTLLDSKSDASITEDRQTYTSSYCSGPVILYQHSSYGGYSAGFWPGTYTLAQIQACGVSDNDISSLRVASGYKVTLYENNNSGGATLVKTADDSTLVDDSWNDRMSSMKVELSP